jgi:hypothetical protein
MEGPGLSVLADEQDPESSTEPVDKPVDGGPASVPSGVAKRLFSGALIF